MWFSIGAALAALAVAAGAFGAHGLEGKVDARGLELWETGARYLFYGALGLALAGLAQRLGVVRSDGLGNAAVWSLALGAGIFSGTLFAMALGAPRWLGAVTPLGGVLLIAGFALIALLGVPNS